MTAQCVGWFKMQMLHGILKTSLNYILKLINNSLQVRKKKIGIDFGDFISFPLCLMISLKSYMERVFHQKSEHLGCTSFFFNSLVGVLRS